MKSVPLFTTLVRNRRYAFGSRVLMYLGREFVEDHPPVYNFLDDSAGEIVPFSLSQLSAMEKRMTDEGELFFRYYHADEEE